MKNINEKLALSKLFHIKCDRFRRVLFLPQEGFTANLSKGNSLDLDKSGKF